MFSRVNAMCQGKLTSYRSDKTLVPGHRMVASPIICLSGRSATYIFCIYLN